LNHRTWGNWGEASAINFAYFPQFELAATWAMFGGLGFVGGFGVRLFLSIGSLCGQRIGSKPAVILFKVTRVSPRTLARHFAFTLLVDVFRL
jgi:hypothetical protein